MPIPMHISLQFCIALLRDLGLLGPAVEVTLRTPGCQLFFWHLRVEVEI